MSGAIADRDRTNLFARYSLVGSLLGAGSALLAIIPDHLARLAGADRVIVYQQAFLAYAAVGLLVIYRRLASRSASAAGESHRAARPIGRQPTSLSAISYLLAARIAARIGLINTMVFTHLPANVSLMMVPLVDELGPCCGAAGGWDLLSQMDVPTRTS